MVTRHSDSTISVRKDVVMFHTVLVIGASKRPIAVAITTNPLEHRAYAQVVMHKSRSHGCSVQVARYVRRTFGIEAPVTTHRATRPVEAMIGWACAGGAQHAPQTDTPWHPTVLHIAETPIGVLLKEVADGHNAARTRYVVYEVRSASHGPLRAVTHRFDAIERWYRECPPDTLEAPDVFLVGRYETMDEARRQVTVGREAGDHLWSKIPTPEYLRKVLRVDERGDVVWTCDGISAVRRYATPSVCIGPRVFAEWRVKKALEHGAWPPDGRTTAGFFAKHS